MSDPSNEDLDAIMREYEIKQQTELTQAENEAYAEAAGANREPREAPSL